MSGIKKIVITFFFIVFINFLNNIVYASQKYACDGLITFENGSTKEHSFLVFDFENKIETLGLTFSYIESFIGKNMRVDSNLYNGEKSAGASLITITAGTILNLPVHKAQSLEWNKKSGRLQVSYYDDSDEYMDWDIEADCISE